MTKLQLQLCIKQQPFYFKFSFQFSD